MPPLCLAACAALAGALALAPAGAAARQDALPSVSISDVSVTEGDAGSTPATFTVTLSGPSTATVTVRYSTRDGSARASGSPRDYNGLSGQVTFAPGETSTTVSISVQGDSLVEPDESFGVILSSPVNATIADAAGVGTIVNDDVARTLSIADVRVTEGDTGSLPATFTVTLSGPTTATVTARFATHDGSARASGSPRDYNGYSGQVTFAPGETSKTVNVYVQGDTEVEPEETFYVVLSQPTNATIDKSAGNGVIVDNDVARTLAIGDVRVQEGDTGSLPAAFPVTLSVASTATVTVRFSTRDGSARASGSPRDYNGLSGQVTFAPGETAKAVNVYVQGDTAIESDESFFVVLGQASGATVTGGTGTGVIANDDVAVTTLSVTVEALLDAKTGSLGLRLGASVPARLLIRLVRGKTTVASWRRDVVAGKSTLSLSARTAKAGDVVQIAAKGRDGATGSAEATVAAAP